MGFERTPSRAIEAALAGWRTTAAKDPRARCASDFASANERNPNGFESDWMAEHRRIPPRRRAEPCFTTVLGATR